MSTSRNRFWVTTTPECHRWLVDEVADVMAKTGEKTTVGKLISALIAQYRAHRLFEDGARAHARSRRAFGALVGELATNKDKGRK